MTRTFWQGATAVVTRNLIVWRAYASASVVGNFGEPILYLVALGFGLGKLVQELGGMTYAEFIGPGLVVSTVMYTSTFEMTYGAYTRLTVQSTYDALLATPVTVRELVAGELLFAGIKSLVGATCVLVVVAAFGLAPSWTALRSSALGLRRGRHVRGHGAYRHEHLEELRILQLLLHARHRPDVSLQRDLLPLEQTPTWAQKLAQVLPLTHVVALVRPLVRGTLSVSSAWPHLLAVTAMTTLFVGLCTRGFERRLRK